ncbi:hypothetical protein EKO04_006320 [Ascochyta lentis]|uniref:Uncharacterized protein n=1 Tax=Ascochyta lentis TaxID=205686 RepID=A0A8H7MHX6_9PLEO|nr:hypothetical protein EKO04_006320 [Ascochyta lentis]
MAKKQKNSKSAKTALARPRTSPYTSRPSKVYFGVDCQQYYVPDVLLQKLDRLPSRGFGEIDIVFRDVEVDTGHVLIHFLHTGTYQTLKDTDDREVEIDEKKVAISEFRKAVRAYEAATKYGLSGLQQLAQAEMLRQGIDMNFDDTVKAISDISISDPSKDNPWLQEYVSHKVRATFEQNMVAFSEPNFFDGISSPTLTKLLAKSIVSLYSEKFSDLQKEKSAKGKSSPSESGAGSISPDLTQLPFRRPASHSEAWPEPDKFGAFDDSSAAWEDPRTLTNGKLSALEAEAMEPPAEPAKKKKKSKKAAILREIAEVEATKIDISEPTPSETIPVTAAQDATQAVVESNEAVAEEPNVIEDVVEAAVEEPRAIEEAIETPQAPVPDPLLDAPSYDSVPPVAAAEAIDVAVTSTAPKKKKKKKILSATASPDLPPAPVPEPVSDVPSVDPFAGLSKSQRKKLEKLMKVEAQSRQLEEENAQLLKQQQEETERLRLLEEEKALGKAEEEEITARKADEEALPEVIAANHAVEAVEPQNDLAPIDLPDEVVPKKKGKKKKGFGFSDELPPPPPPPECEPESVPDIESSPPGVDLELEITTEGQTVECAPEPEVEVNPLSVKKEKSRWTWYMPPRSTKTKKQKTKKDVVFEEASLESDPVPVPEPEPELAVEAPPPEVEPELEPPIEPPPPVEKGEDSWGDSWDAPVSLSKKKKSKKTKSAAVCDKLVPESEPVVEPPPPEVEPEPEPATELPPVERDEDPWGDGWGSLPSSFKKKKSKKGKSSAVFDEPVPEPEPAPGSDLIEPNIPVEDADVARSTVEVVSVPEADNCPWRQEHLSEGDGWRTCTLCETYMRDIALKLHSAGLVDVNGLIAAR